MPAFMPSKENHPHLDTQIQDPGKDDAVEFDVGMCSYWTSEIKEK